MKGNIMKPMTDLEVCNMLRGSDMSIKRMIKSVAASKGMNMMGYVNMIMEKHFKELLKEEEKA